MKHTSINKQAELKIRLGNPIKNIEIVKQLIKIKAELNKLTKDLSKIIIANRNTKNKKLWKLKTANKLKKN